MQVPFPPPPPTRIQGQTYTHGHSTSENAKETDRTKHLTYLHSLLHVLLQRHPTLSDDREKDANAVRVGRIVRLLWSTREWRQGQLWEVGLAWAGLPTSQDGQQQASMTERRIQFLSAVSSRCRGLRPLMLANRAQELITLGRWKEALDEIELVIQASPYRSSPELNLYAGLLVVLIDDNSSNM
ncbi:unnamed protein product [Sympodiomycopsis kandeliae]